MGFHIRILAGHTDRQTGSHVYHQELIRRLAGRGHRISVVCFESAPEVVNYAEIFEVPPINFHERKVLWRFASLLQYWHLSRQFLRMKIEPADIVIGGEHLFIKAHRRRFLQTPMIYLPHSLEVSQEIQSYQMPALMGVTSTRVYLHLQKWSLRHSDCTVRFTQHACEVLKSRYRSQIHSRFVVNPMGVELPTLSHASPLDAKVRLLWVGQLISRKRIDFVLDALAKLQQYNWCFDIVGDGDSRKALERKTNALGLQDRVRFHGFQKTPSVWYQRADLLLFPSWLENSPVTMLESMSHGVPCLAMRADGVHFHNANSEIIEHGVDGFLAKSDEDFKFQLEKILQEPKILTQVGQAARETIVNHHTWDRHLDRYEELFGELLLESQHKGYAVNPVATNLSSVR